VAPKARRRWPIWAGLILVIAGLFATAIYMRDTLVPVLGSLRHHAQLILSSSPLGSVPYFKSETESLPAKAVDRVPIAASRAASTLPLPDSYGFYAVSDGQVTRLESLHIRVPDSRIALPGLISRPSLAILPNGRLFFIAYQRDLATNAPDTASIRIVAQVRDVLSFGETGTPKVTPVADTWAIRAVSVDLRVAPVPENREMLVIQASDPNLSLAPGRYMLVFNNQAYEFTVEGEVSDSAHCLERTETQNGDVYTECRALP
jgi:hypothetical protein